MLEPKYEEGNGSGGWMGLVVDLRVARRRRRWIDGGGGREGEVELNVVGGEKRSR